MKIPEPKHTTSAAIYEAIERNNNELPRPHLGASLIGHHCERWLWLSFRWAVREKFSGRILRLFRRGQEEEKYLVADMRAAGIEMDAEENGKQYRVEVLPHFGGSMDGVIHKGVPEAPSKKHVFEAKTHSKKSFDDLLKNGVEKSKPQHFAQCQVYMGGTGIDRALYVAVCKDDDRIYTERVKFDAEIFEKLKAKAERIIFTDRMPEPISADPSWYQCKFCPAHTFCHKSHWATEVNCRTCAHSTAKDDGTWHCARWDDTIPTASQHTGCDSHVFHPDLVPFTFVDGDGVSALYRDGNKEFWNGEKGLKSVEIIRADLES